MQIYNKIVRRISIDLAIWSSLILITLMATYAYSLIFKRQKIHSITYIYNSDNRPDPDKICFLPPYEDMEPFFEEGKADSKIYNSLDFTIQKVCEKYNMDPALIKAIIKAESDYNPKAVSKKGAVGLMQVMPSTAKELGFKDIYDPKSNIEAGVKYLRYLMDHFNGDLILTLAAYNAGLNRVKRHRGVPPIVQTKRYIKKVLKYYREYKASV